MRRSEEEQRESPTPEVREARDADMGDIVDVYVRAYAQPPWNERHDPARSEDYLRWVMRTPQTRCLVSCENGCPPIGFVLVGLRAYEEFVQDWERLAERPPGGWPPIPGTLGYIWEIAVDPGFQRRGHGAALMRAAIKSVAADGASALVLRTSERAEPATALYRRFGFVRLPIQERWDPLSGPWVLRLD